MKTRIACLFLAAILLGALPACRRNAQPANAPVAGETSAETEAALYSAEPTGTEPEGSTADIEITTNESLTTDESQAAAEITAPVGGSAAQIVAFYNKQAGKVKAADRITIQKHDVRNMNMEVPALLKGLMPKEADELMNQNTTVTETFVNGKGTKDAALKLNDFMPVNGTPYVSTLKPSLVKSANCAAQGDGWIVRINLKDEKMDMTAMQQNALNMDIENMSEAEREKMRNEMMENFGYAACMDMSMGNGMPERDASQAQNLPGFINPEAMMDSMNMNAGFQNGAITAIFDGKGQLTSLTLSYSNYSRVSFLGMKMNMNSSSKQEYQFIW